MNTSIENEVIEISDSGLLSGKPVLSVFMITYNHEHFIEQAIDSILAQQTDFPFELVIGEDCSTDRTRQIALEYQHKFPEKIRVLYSKNNVGSSRNVVRTLNACRGQYIAICEGDDYWTDPLKLAKQVAWLETHPDSVITYHDTKTISEDNSEVIRENLQAECTRGYSKKPLQIGAHIPTLSLCFRNVIGELPPEFLRVVNSDTFLISLLGCYGRADYLADIAPAMYRHHAGGIWSAIGHDEKIVKSIATHFWLSLYHRREGREQLANIFIYKIIGQLMRYFSKKGGFAPKWFFSFVFPKQYQALRWLLNKIGLKKSNSVGIAN